MEAKKDTFSNKRNQDKKRLKKKSRDVQKNKETYPSLVANERSWIPLPRWLPGIYLPTSEGPLRRTKKRATLKAGTAEWPNGGMAENDPKS